MIELQQPLFLERKPGKSSLIFWLRDTPNGRYPFRLAIVELEQMLGGSACAWHSLPEEEPDEDFVEGEFHWLERRLFLYFEHALGYLQFSSTSHNDIQALHDALLPNPSFQRTAFGSR